MQHIIHQYFYDYAPWKLVTTDPVLTQKVLTTTLNLFRMITIYLSPVLPQFSQKVSKLFGDDDYLEFRSVMTLVQNKKIQTYQHLMTRIDPVKVKSMMDEAKTVAEKMQALKAKAKTGTTVPKSSVSVGSGTTTSTAKPGESLNSGKISIDDFMKVDLRVAEILEAEIIPEADKLLRLKVSLGDETRQIILHPASAVDHNAKLTRSTQTPP